MSMTMSVGDAGTATDADFSGTVSLRNLNIAESLQNFAGEELAKAFRGSTFESMRLGRLFGGQVSVNEAFSTSDFTYAAFKELDTELLARYEELPAVWTQYTDQTLVSDFRPKRLVSRKSSIIGLGRVPEGSEYPSNYNQDTSALAITVAKYGRRRQLTWERWLNNEAVDELENIPEDLAVQARETESVVALSNFLAITGNGVKDPWTAATVNTQFFNAGNGNAPTALPLNAQNLKTVLDSMTTRKDSDGKTIVSPELMVVVPKSLQSQLEAILRVTEVRRTVDGVTTIESNPLAGTAYAVEPMLDQLLTHAKAAGTWFVVPKPGSIRPAMWAAKLRGHEQPDLRVKINQGSAIGGSAISFEGGSFEIDTLEWRARHVLGAQTGDSLFTYCSYGS